MILKTFKNQNFSQKGSFKVNKFDIEKQFNKVNYLKLKAPKK